MAADNADVLAADNADVLAADTTDVLAADNEELPTGGASGGVFPGENDDLWKTSVNFDGFYNF